MSLKVPSIEKLTLELSKLPGIGQKTAQRLALSIVKKKGEDIESLRGALLDVKEKINECSVCFSYTENKSECDFCKDEIRKSIAMICVVSSPTDILKIENSGAFKGQYHVLHGCIAPLDGVGPEDLKLHELFERVERLKRETKEDSSKGIEVVLALDADIEGDTTSLYIKEMLAKYDVVVTRLAHGVPIGSFIDFIDARTLTRALENRVKL